jgi:membrane-bound serine protease (ClpP class)
MRILRSLLLAFWLTFLMLPSVSAQNDGVLWLTAEGAVTPAMSVYIQRGLHEAQTRGAQLVVLQLNTPGGQVSIMEDIVRALRASPLPVVVYVAPRGAMAGSAGTVITLAGHLAAMAPETAIGAASPVGPQGEDLEQTLEAKTKEILKAMARSLAEGRPPQAIRLIESTIDEARAVTAAEALQAGMVDIVAADRADLLRQLDGRQVTTAAGSVTLRTQGAAVQEMPHTITEQLLQLLTNPNIVFLLLAVGAQAVLIELSSPGGWVSGFVGVICLALAFYGMGILSVNWFGLVFIVTAFVLFLLDIKAPTHGALTVAGLGSFIAGALVLFNSPGTPDVQHVSVPLVVGTALVTAAIFFAAVTAAVRAHRRPVLTGRATLVGQRGEVRTALTPHGLIQAGGELWSAQLTDPAERAAPGEWVEVTGTQGLQLLVRKVQHGFIQEEHSAHE